MPVIPNGGNLLSGSGVGTPGPPGVGSGNPRQSVLPAEDLPAANVSLSNLLPFTPIGDESVQWIRDGQSMHYGIDYVVSGKLVTFLGGSSNHDLSTALSGSGQGNEFPESWIFSYLSSD